MEQYTALQQQYPLSPRKFWKKMIEKLSFLYILGFIVTVIDLAIMFNIDKNESMGHTVLWLILIVGFIFTVFVTAIYAWYVKVYIKRYYYDANENFITIKKGFFAPTEIHVQWQKIQDVYVDQDILDRIMGLYDVHIASATFSSGMEAHIDGLDERSANGMKNVLLDKVSGRNTNNEQSTNGENIADNTIIPSIPEKISSKEYPLSNKWLGVSVAQSILTSWILPGVIVGLILTEITDSFANITYMILIWMGLSILNTIISLIRLFLWRHNYAFNFGKDNIYMKQGVISISENHMPYSSIQNVIVEQGVIERLFGLGKVVIENAGQQMIMNNDKLMLSSGIVIQGILVKDAETIANILRTTVLGKNTKHHGL